MDDFERLDITKSEEIEPKSQNINVNVSQNNKNKFGILAILGIITIILFLFSMFIDIQAYGFKCLHGEGCGELTKVTLAKVFLIDYTINNEVNYVSLNKPTNFTGDNSFIIQPSRAVRLDLFVNVCFFLILLVLISWFGFKVCKGGATGLIGVVFALFVYLLIEFIITWFFTKTVYIPFSSIINLFKNFGAVL
jgi:hypothetical protein